MSFLMESETNYVAATTGGAGTFRDTALALLFWQPLRYFMTKSNSCMASAHRQSKPSIFCDSVMTATEVVRDQLVVQITFQAGNV